MFDFYEWFRAFHIIAVIAWMAGLLIYPRLLVYRLEAAGNPGFEAAMDKAANSTRKIILTPTMILAWLMALAMIGHRWEYFIGQPWFWAKILLVVGLSGFHGFLMGLGRKITAGERPIEPKKLRMLNEIPMVIAIFAVIAVVVQPFGR
ncbi:MAG TPA: CopD family protein [Hyphomonadaceae bacterium]|jgi:putative membrane protein|nr:CopD family protein [Hyphomonadaceae bacterium]